MLLLLWAAAAACTDDGPTAPSLVEGGAVTTLAVEPDVGAVPGASDARVTLSVWPHEAGGRVTIELCADTRGRALPAASDTDCPELGGHWQVARDREGGLWIDRAWPGYASVRFERQADMAPMLFRTTYDAPRGGTTRSVRGCRWVLAEGSDVGVACTSDDQVRVLPWRASGQVTSATP